MRNSGDGDRKLGVIINDCGAFSLYNLISPDDSMKIAYNINEMVFRFGEISGFNPKVDKIYMAVLQNNVGFSSIRVGNFQTHSVWGDSHILLQQQAGSKEL